MAYLKPPWFTAKVFNKIAMATGVSGTETLTVTTRTSGQQQMIPVITCLLYTSPSPRDGLLSRMPSSA